MYRRMWEAHHKRIPCTPIRNTQLALKAPHEELVVALNGYVKREYFNSREILPEKGDVLDDDFCQAIAKAEQLESINSTLPGLDCGACGAPSCRALAEDIVRELASEMDCMFKLRQEVHLLAESMLDLAKRVPPAIGESWNKSRK